MVPWNADPGDRSRADRTTLDGGSIRLPADGGHLHRGVVVAESANARDAIAPPAGGVGFDRSRQRCCILARGVSIRACVEEQRESLSTRHPRDARHLDALIRALEVQKPSKSGVVKQRKAS